MSPHPSLITPGEIARPYIDTLPPADMPAGGVLDAARCATRQALRWPSRERGHSMDTGASSLGNLKLGQVTNCAGYATVHSETLSHAGLDHFVAFGNGHAGLLVPLNDTWRYEDAMFNGLSGPVGNALFHREVGGIPKQIETYGHAGVRLNTTEMLIAQNQNVPETRGAYPWLRYDGETAIFNDNLSYKRTEESHYTFALSLYPPAIGRAVLQQYVGMTYEIGRGDYPKAALHLRAMRGFYPEIDARNSHENFKRLFTELMKVKKYSTARDALGYYFSSFALSNDPRFAIAEGDFSRKLAAETSSKIDAGRAVDAYQRALRQGLRFGRDMVVGKIAKTERLAFNYA